MDLVDIVVDDTIDKSLLDELCWANEMSIPDDTPSVLDQMVEANAKMEEEPEMSDLDKLYESLIEKVLEENESSTPLLDSAPPELVAQVDREMNNEDGGWRWHNQEYAMAEAEQRLGLLMQG